MSKKTTHYISKNHIKQFLHFAITETNKTSYFLFDQVIDDGNMSFVKEIWVPEVVLLENKND